MAVNKSNPNEVTLVLGKKYKLLHSTLGEIEGTVRTLDKEFVQITLEGGSRAGLKLRHISEAKEV